MDDCLLPAFLMLMLLFSCTYFCNGECRNIDFLSQVEGKALKDHVIMALNVSNEGNCMAECYAEERCVSYNLGPYKEGFHICELNDADDVMHQGDLREKADYLFRAVKNPCSKNPCVSDNSTICLTGFTDKGYKCQKAKSCLILKEHTASKESGVYSIKPRSDRDALNVYCDQKHHGGGWTMIFKVVAGADKEPVPGTFWSSGTSKSVPEALDLTNNHKAHYRNYLLDLWKATSYCPKEVLVAVYNNGTELKFIQFSALSCDILQWFTQENIQNSSWIDLNTTVTYHVFNIVGRISSDRSFEISKDYAGCHVDHGWLVVTGKNCFWEQNVLSRRILFSKSNTFAYFGNKEGGMGEADVLAVFIR